MTQGCNAKNKLPLSDLEPGYVYLYLFLHEKQKFVQRQIDKDKERQGYTFAYIWSTFIKTTILESKKLLSHW